MWSLELAPPVLLPEIISGNHNATPFSMCSMDFCRRTWQMSYDAMNISNNFDECFKYNLNKFKLAIKKL